MLTVAGGCFVGAGVAPVGTALGDLRAQGERDAERHDGRRAPEVVDQIRQAAYAPGRIDGASALRICQNDMTTRQSLRYVDPRAPRGPVYRAYARLASSRFATWLSKQAIWSAIVWKIDPHLLRWTAGRLGTGLLLPTALLQTRGARTGLIRRNAVIYFHDGERVTIFASQAGRPEHPAWFYNARANPDVTFGGLPFQAEIVEDRAECVRLWELADRIFPAFAAYRDSAGRAGREIPILQLVAREIAAQNIARG